MRPDLQYRFRDYFDVSGGAAALVRALPLEGHVHTEFADGRSTAAECAARAAELKLHTIAFTEHVRKDAPWIDAYFEEIVKLKSKYDKRLTIICGVEARALDAEGTLDASDETLKRAELVVGSVHGFPPRGNEPADIFHVHSREESLELEWALLQGLARNPAVHILGHPFGAYQDRFGNPPRAHILKLLRCAADADKAVEINCGHMDVKWFLECAAGFDGDFYFWPGSDAHHARDVGRWITEIETVD
jgi:histidinol phosphatase-like PHP family hydrolase